MGGRNPRAVGEGFGALRHLFARFRGLDGEPEVLRFLEVYGASQWGEERTDAGNVVVTLISLDGRRALQVLRAAGTTRVLPVAQLPATPSTIALALRDILWDRGLRQRENALTLSYSEAEAAPRWFFHVSQGATTSFAIELALDGGLLSEHPYAIDVLLPQEGMRAAPADDPLYPGDNLAVNDLHHATDPWLLREAQSLATDGSPRTTAQRVMEHFQEGGAGRMKYWHGDADTFRKMAQFIYSDRAIERVGRVGVCDEFSVMQVSFLRALGVPARIVYIAVHQRAPENPQDPWAQHAPVEYWDGGRWVNLDGLWGLHDNPAHYKEALDGDYVLARWQGFPDDSVSTAPASGFQDATGDGLLNVAEDWRVITEYTSSNIYS